MRVLFVTAREPRTRSSGYDLRVQQLARVTPGEVHLAVLPLEPPAPERDAEGSAPVFRSVRHIDDLAGTSLRPWRHLRWSNHRYLRRSRPREFARAVERLTGLVEELAPDWVVLFSGDLAEVVVATGHPRTILDVCDSASLTRRRELEVLPRTGRGAHLRARLELLRARSLEARLPAAFTTVATISEQDSAEVRSLAGGPGNVVTIPNGVDEEFVTDLPPAGARHGVAFWGNLDFGPNVEAMRYFLHEVWRPHLRDHGVVVRVVGANAPGWLERIAESDDRVELTGFVPDLRRAVCEFPVTVNPMRTGSGLKNKVLEAFGMGLVVVTTTRGVEALTGVRAGVHAEVADDARSFADAVLALLADGARREAVRSAAHDLLVSEYRWTTIGEAWRALFRETG